MKSLSMFVLRWKGLALASSFCVAVLVARIYLTDSFRFAFLLWNLFLAFIPLAISDFLVHQAKVSALKVVFGAGVWLLFFPNAPYIVTDLIHLTKMYKQIPWLDSVLIFSFAITALTTGVISMVQLKQTIGRAFSAKIQRMFLILVIPLTGFGIYLGRFERWNSWDLLTHPHDLLLNCTENLCDKRAMCIALVFSGCLYITHQLILQASQTIYDTDKKMPE